MRTAPGWTLYRCTTGRRCESSGNSTSRGARRIGKRIADQIREIPRLAQFASELQSPAGTELQLLPSDVLVEDRWDSYVAKLRAQGEHYAVAGVRYSAWFDLLRSYRDAIREPLIAFVEDNPRNFPRAAMISHGLNRVLDLMTDQIGEAYLSAKQMQVTAAENQLRHAQKMDAIGMLAGGVAHDFNNILTVIESYACLLEESLEPSDARHEEAVQIRRAADRGAQITRQLLAVSRHSVARPQPIILDDLVADFMPMLRRLAGAAVAIVPHRGSAPNVLVDRSQMEQVLMNLVGNARDAMPDGGRLTIESREVTIDSDAANPRRLPPGRYVELAVTDTGTGMDLETQQRIFDPFFTTKAAGKGTGLGLAIVHGIVGQAGGSIAVYSEPGHGTTFRVYLPAVEDSVAVPDQAATVAPRLLPPIRVLIVDDQADIRTVAARILHDAGCSVLEAASADEARRICVSHDDPIDVVLLDVVLSDARGRCADPAASRAPSRRCSSSRCRVIRPAR